ncbi:MAG: hypothetical protein KG003_06145 [Bacteroidetes bacterium]|nr:hypothetical protein [Bacteroidota bacterium]
MKFNFLFSLAIFCCVAFVFSACNKEHDNEKPVIHLQRPVNGDSVVIGAMVYLQGSVTDNDAVHNIAYEIRTVASDSLIRTFSEHYHEKSGSFSDSFLMPSGDVKIHIEAEDHAENESELEVKVFGKK